MANYKEFFDKHVKIIKDNRICCKECGDRLIGDYSEVCHILPKGTFKSIAENDNNIIYLCSWKSRNNCHSKLDDSKLEIVKSMKIFEECKTAVNSIIQEVKEKINYKIYEKWEIG